VFVLGNLRKSSEREVWFDVEYVKVNYFSFFKSLSSEVKLYISKYKSSILKWGGKKVVISPIFRTC